MARPTFFALAVMTLDGRIAKHSNHESSWSSKADKMFLRKKLAGCDVIVVGKRTYDVSRKPLSKRNCIALTRSVATTRRAGERCLYCNPRETSLKRLIQQLGYRTVCVLGGTKTYSLMLKLGLLDELLLTVEPLVFGAGLPLFDLAASPAPRFHLVSIKKLNRQGTLLLHYRRSQEV